MLTHSIEYLKKAGFDFKSVESPDIWPHLEGRLTTSTSRVGSKFIPMSGQMISELVSRGEDALLDAMVKHHQMTGHLDRVEQTIELPFVVGLDARVPSSNDPTLQLVDHPGTVHESIVHLLLSEPDHIPGTHKVTFCGGLYSNGHTAGFYNFLPGTDVNDSAPALLATSAEIMALTREMEENADNITTLSRSECETMIEKARRILG